MWYIASRHTEMATGVSFALNNFCMWNVVLPRKVARKLAKGKYAIKIAYSLVGS
jgi:hypothetical protein